MTSQDQDQDRDFDRGNRLLAAGDLTGAIAAFTRQLAVQPDDWQALANRALAGYRAGAYDKALDDYCRALALKPDSPNLLTNFAALLKELGQLDAAEDLLLKALALAPDHADAWSNLGIVRLYRMRYDEAAQCQINAIEHGGNSAARWTNLGNALTGGLHLDDAVEAYRNALSLDPDNADARYNLSIPLLTLGRYREAWPYYEARWQSILTPRLTERRWQGEALGRRTLLVWSEQGLGDCLQMVRFLPLLHRREPAARLILACPRSLHRLFSCLPGVTLADADATPDFDLQLPIASLPGIFDVARDALPLAPYLSVPDSLVAAWGTRLPPARPGRRRVGLVWQSGVWGVGARDLCRQQKSIDPALLLPLLPLADVVSLQPEALPEAFAGQVFAPEIGDFADTAAIMRQLDLVVSVDTAAAHLAGALGVPVRVLMRHEGAPFFGVDGETAPWYPSARVLRQPEPGAWQPVLVQLAAELSAAAAGSAR